MESPLRIAAFALLLSLAAPAARADVGHVVPPGQEDLVAAMLGRGEALGGCRLVQVDMHPSAIDGTYRCEGVQDAVVVVLEYPSTDPRVTFSTLKFAVSTRGPVPEGLLDALRRRIVEREPGWSWLAANDSLALAPAADARAGTGGGGWVWLPPAAAGAAMLLVFAFGLTRGRR